MQWILNENVPVVSGVYRMTLSGDARAITHAGQFVQVKVPGFYLRRPISVCDWRPTENGSITLVYKTVGHGTEGMAALPIGTAQDHKRVGDGDTGPNTGGMGAYSPAPVLTEALQQQAMEQIVLPTIREMARRGTPYQGVLYAGLMIEDGRARLVEYNCRFGDPETQAVLPLLKSDLLTVMQATTNGTLADASVEFSTGSACCVVLASEGYPQKYESGFPITMSEEAAAHCYVAGAKKDSDTLLTAGGRVLGVTAVAPTLRAAVEDAYHLAEGVDFANKYCRGDIGSAALAAREERG